MKRKTDKILRSRFPTPLSVHIGVKNIFWYYLTLDGWTETGQKIQPLSKHCQISVQGQSRNRSCRGFVQLLSKSGQISVKLVSNSKSSGHRLDMKIHSLSKLCPLKFKMLPFFCIGQYLDKYWTWEKVSGFIF